MARRGQIESVRIVQISPGGTTEVEAEFDRSWFGRVIREFVTRGDCTLVLSLVDGLEIAINLEAGDWQVAMRESGEPPLAAVLASSTHWRSE